MDKPEKKQKIQWDEETIAEHDKERGSRSATFEFTSHDCLFKVASFYFHNFVHLSLTYVDKRLMRHRLRFVTIPKAINLSVNQMAKGWLDEI